MTTATKTTKRRKKVVQAFNIARFKRKPPKQYVKDLNALVNLCFERANKIGMNDTQIANQSGLSVTTVQNLRNCITLYPNWLTVWKISRGLRLHIQFKRLSAKHQGGSELVGV